ncbi:MAG: GNAT family N-acetyltransferase [Acidobacteria bacterium]|nr:GNAT family N-acetyltransferase [Acidobacteriota bacterium]
MLTIRELDSDHDLRTAFPLMAQLRDRITSATFVDELRRQHADGYRLIGGFANERLVALAGIRHAHTLSRGPHLFVDDLVTDEREQGQGYGRELLASVEALASAAGLPRVYLDSRATAQGFYERVGYTFLTAIPCWKEVRRAS